VPLLCKLPTRLAMLLDIWHQRDRNMTTRAEILLAPVPREGRIIEIGPSFSPIAPKSAGWNSASIDHLTRDGLVAKYTGFPGVDVSQIESVDFVWSDGPLSAAVPTARHSTFDAFIASHVIEHTPDLIAFLDSATTLLKPEGVVILAIPDKRYCFDYFQQLTTTGQLLDAHAERRSRHTSSLAFDHFAYQVEDGGAAAWSPRPSQGICFVNKLETARDYFSTFKDSSDYLDLHAWHFVPSSFELLLLELARLEMTDWRVESITPAEGCEFFAWLRRGGAAKAAAMSGEELAAQRMTLLKRTLLETKAQIDWLLEGEPELITGLRPAVVPTPADPAILEPVTPCQAETQQRAAALEAEVVMARAERDALLNSATWRATLPLRRVGAAMPVPARRAIRHMLRAGTWLVGK
jgi:SAM-dependent methyltransferase